MEVGLYVGKVFREIVYGKEKTKNLLKQQAY
jgi:hypothetical protein